MSGLRVPVDGSSCQDFSHHCPTIPIQQQHCQHPGPTRPRIGRPYARGPFRPHVNPMRCAWATLPTCTSRGLCAYQRVNAHVQGFAYKRHTTAPKTQTTSTTTPRLSAFFTEVVCTLGTTPPQTVISPPPNGGNDVIRTTTRRRHADSQLLMLQNPHRHRRGGHRRDLPPPTGTHSGRGLRRPQHPWGHSNTWRPITPILIVGPNQPKYRLSRTRKPKSHAPSNTRSVLYPRIAARAGGYTKAAPRRRRTRPTENVLNEISASRTAKPCGPS